MHKNSLAILYFLRSVACRVTRISLFRMALCYEEQCDNKTLGLRTYLILGLDT